MKKRFLILGMIICMLALTACGRQEKKEDIMSTQEAGMFAENIILLFDEVVSQQNESNFIVAMKQSGMDGAVFEQALSSWKNASEDMGNYQKIVEVTGNTMTYEDDNGTRYAVDGMITVEMKGSLRNAEMEIVYKDSMPASITTNVKYSFGETMEKAALNTLLGMGTVFTVLILISLIISCFGVIPKIQAGLAKKPAEEKVREATVDNAIQQIIEKEELTDDLELVAVISAAIAASEGASSTDGFVVRSIRRAGNKWQRA